MPTSWSWRPSGRSTASSTRSGFGGLVARRSIVDGRNVLDPARGGPPAGRTGRSGVPDGRAAGRPGAGHPRPGECAVGRSMLPEVMTYDKDMPHDSSPTGAPSGVEVRPSACRPAPLAGDLRVALTRATRRLRLERSSDQITDGQYAALAALANRGPMTTTALAEDQHVQPPPMSRTVSHLVDAAWSGATSTRTRPAAGAVSSRTPGITEVKETRRRRNDWLARRLAELDPAEREVLARAAVLLERIATS